MSPALPVGFEVMFALVAVAIVALTVLSIVSIARRKKEMSVLANGAWMVAVVLFPIAAPLAWFALGAPEVDKRRAVA